MIRFTVFVLSLLSAFPAGATPPQMVANVYRLTEAAAVLEVCFGSAEFGKLPREKAQALRSHQQRIGGLVHAIAKHYRDGGLYETYEATRARIAGEGYMKDYGRSKYRYCSDPLAADMERYVAEHEKLLNGYFSSQASQKPAK
jgi:hypothetical protein